MSFCPICFDEIQGATNIVVTDCGHSFHCNCLMMNASCNGFSCPCCRNIMNQKLTIVVPTENPVFEPTSPPENEENEFREGVTSYKKNWFYYYLDDNNIYYC